MIWFACKQCGKKHGRGEDMIGTLVFCECGAGNRVPWSSTTTEPEEVPPLAEPVPPPPAADERREPSRPPRPRPQERPINNGFCFNHEETPSGHACAACGIGFCSNCVVILNGTTLCAPCKNFRLRLLSRPEQVSGKGILSLVLALVGGPVAFVLTLMAIGFRVENQGTTGGGLLLCLLGGLLPEAAVLIGLFALREIETRPHTGGRAVALTGVATGLFGTLWSLTFVLVLIGKQMQG